jgi:hypothetical protein
VKIDFYIENGSSYAAAIDRKTGAAVQLGAAPPDLALDFEAIVDP